MASISTSNPVVVKITPTKNSIFYLQDFGSDWTLWEAKIPKKRFLRKNLQKLLDNWTLAGFDLELVFLP